MEYRDDNAALLLRQDTDRVLLTHEHQKRALFRVLDYNNVTLYT